MRSLPQACRAECADEPNVGAAALPPPGRTEWHHRSITLEVLGDDDVWVFINKRLAINVGGLHLPVKGSVVLDGARGTEMGLVDGQVYEVAVFQAERMATASTLKVTLPGFNTAASVCRRN